MNISYVAHIRLPTEKAHGYQIMRVCSELSKLGHEVTLYVPYRRDYQDDPFAWYGVEKNFDVVHVRCMEWMRFVRVLGPFAFFAQQLSFLLSLWRRGGTQEDTAIFTRDPLAVWFFAKKGIPVAYNAHTWPHKRTLITYLLKGARGIVANSSGTALVAKEISDVPTTVIHNATDANPFRASSKSQLRTELHLPLEKKIALYSGHLYTWKGSSLLLEAALRLADRKDILIAVVGGREEDVRKLNVQIRGKNLHNIILLGYQKKELIPKYLASADLLLLPNTAGTEESVRFTSPLKLFEYMASGVPILSADLPSLREIVSDEQVYFFPPGDVDAFSEQLAHTLEHPEEARTRAERALEASYAYTWNAHAKHLAEFLHSIS